MTLVLSESERSARLCFHNFFRLWLRRPELFKHFLVRLHQQRIICPSSHVLSCSHVCIVRNIFGEDYFRRVSGEELYHRAGGVSDLYDFSELSSYALIYLVYWGGDANLCSSFSSFLQN